MCNATIRKLKRKRRAEQLYVAMDDLGDTNDLKCALEAHYLHYDCIGNHVYRFEVNTADVSIVSFRAVVLSWAKMGSAQISRRHSYEYIKRVSRGT